MKNAQPEADETAKPLLPSRGPLAPLIPDHELLQRVGGGSYGEVWLARNVMGELRAVKIIQRSRFNDVRPFEREFEGIRRFEPISRSHPSQLAILHVGKNDDAGCFYYVMELADDATERSDGVMESRSDVTKTEVEHSNTPPLHHSVDAYSPHTLRHDLEQRGRLPIADCIQIGLSLTTALAHLHKNGLVHRDIKPSNVIFVNGVAKLGDIGLVTESGDTQSIVGTEGYIPPEGPGTPQADIFSLGKVLYEISTGLDRRRFAELPEDLRAWPDRSAVVEFNEILLKACAKNPEQRYRSTDELRADLELLQGGQSVKRRRAWQRRGKIARKFVLMTSAVAIVLVAVYSSVWRPKPPNIKLSQIPTANEEYQSGLVSLHTSSQEAPAQGARHLERAVELDPRFAAAHARLSSAYVLMGPTNPEMLKKAREAAVRAVALDSRLSEAHAMLATVKLLLELDWSAAEKERQLARELNPNSEDTMVESALNLATMGRTNEAVMMIEQALRIDSRSVTRLRHAGNVFLWSRQFDRAIQKFEEVIEMSPSIRARIEKVNLAAAYLGKREYLKSLQHERQGELLEGRDPKSVKTRFDGMEEALRENGTVGYWRKKLELEEAGSEGKNFVRLAAIHAELGNSDLAFDYLERAFKETPPTFAFNLNTNPSFDTLRSDKRWSELTTRLWRR